MQTIGDLLPVAAAVALSPIPIVAVVLVLDSGRARVNGPMFAAGWVAGLVVVSILVVTFADSAGDPGSEVATGVNWLMVLVGVAFLAMAVQQWTKRPRPGQEPALPAWMAGVSSLSPVKAAALGIALSAANPKNLALTLTASATIARAGLDGADQVIAVATFVALGSVTVAGAVALFLVAPSRAERPLAAVRRFMADNNATIMMVILLILGLKILGDALGGLGS